MAELQTFWLQFYHRRRLSSLNLLVFWLVTEKSRVEYLVTVLSMICDRIILISGPFGYNQNACDRNDLNPIRFVSEHHHHGYLMILPAPSPNQVTETQFWYIFKHSVLRYIKKEVIRGIERFMYHLKKNISIDVTTHK